MKPQGWLLTDRFRQYIPAAKTTPETLTELFRQHGYVPPTEIKKRLKKAINNEGTPQ